MHEKLLLGCHCHSLCLQLCQHQNTETVYVLFLLGCMLLPAALRAAQACRYLIYSEADFEVFRPAGPTRCTDGGEIWRGGGTKGPLLHAKFNSHGCNDKGVGPPK